MKKPIELYAPEGYWQTLPEVLKQITNGCGTSGWKGALVPDTIYLLDIKPACNIHDYMYAAGLTLAAKKEADRVFLNNMLRIIDAAGGCSLLRMLRRRRAKIYYEAVHHFGGPAFWDGKNEPQTVQEPRLRLA